jgi:hypothetical protein
VHRRLLTILLPLAATVGLATATAGCSTFSDSDAAARVDDSELSPDELSALVDVLASETATSGDTVRQAIGLWIQIEAANGQLVADGNEPSAADLDTASTELSTQLADFDTLADDTRAVLVGLQATSNAINAQLDPQGFVTGAVERADVYVNPRFGTFDPTLGVVALGLAPTAATPEIAG